MRTSLAALLLAIAGCATEKPPPPAQEAPPAAIPSFIGILHTSERPARQGTGLSFGEITELKGCPYNPAVVAIPAGGGLLVRFKTPVPTELGIGLDTAQGPRRVAAPQDLDDEARLVQTGRAYFYENELLARQAATGSVAPREVALWSARTNDRRFDLLIWDRSYAPQTFGDELQSPAMRVSLVGACPDVALSLMQSETELRPGQIRRIHARIVPTGDGVGTLTIALSVAGAPKGVTIDVHDPEFASANWTSPRETAFDIGIGNDAVPGKFELTLVARLGAIERRAPFMLTVLPKDDY